MLLRRQIGRVIIASIALFLVSGLSPPLHADPDARTFPETGQTVRGLFLHYWDTHGGLAQLGYPISEEIQERNASDGQTYTVQYFERAVFAAHPENAPPYDVLLARLGAAHYEQKYPNGAPGQEPNTTPGSVAFPETGKRLGGDFLQYWQSHGGLAQQGYPISDEFWETSDLDGHAYRVQYFERAGFEAHPENASPYDVLLSQLGTFAYQARYASPEPELQVDLLRDEGVLYVELTNFMPEGVPYWLLDSPSQPVTLTDQFWFDAQNLYRVRQIETEMFGNESHIRHAVGSNGVDAWFEMNADERHYNLLRHTGRFPYEGDDLTFDRWIHSFTADRLYERLARGELPQVGARDEAPWGKLLTTQQEWGDSNYVLTSTVRAEAPHILVSSETVSPQGKLYHRAAITRWGWYASGALRDDFWLSPPPNIPQRPPE